MCPPATDHATGRRVLPVRLERAPSGIDLLACAALGDGPRQVLTVRGWTIALSGPLQVCHDLAEASRIADQIGWREARAPHLPPFVGGLAGMISDDISAGLLDLDPHDARPAAAPTPAVSLALYDTAACQAPDGTVWLMAADLPQSRTPSAQRLARLREQVAHLPRPAPVLQRPPRSTARLSLDAAEHRARVAQVLEWIAAGDLYQLNLTAHVSAPWNVPGPLPGQALARRLWAASPSAAHAAWLALDDHTEVVSVSPETFLTVDGDRAAIRPIKGTRPRATTVRDDQEQRAALLASAKDHAEHVMIVDLERNDLGRVAVPGSVQVPEFAALEAHPTVWHLASTVTATLRPDVDLAALLAATFPCGSVTGAPKRMAVQRIRQVEPLRRGVYCGAIGVISHGLVDLSVAIRTAVVHDGWAHYGSGGGIVADSDAAQEWDELLHKAEAFFAATNSRPAAGGAPATGPRS